MYGDSGKMWLPLRLVYAAKSAGRISGVSLAWNAPGITQTINNSMTLITRTLVLLRDKSRENRKRFLRVVDTCNHFAEITKLKYIYNGSKHIAYSSHEEILQAWANMEKQYGKEGLKDVFMLTTDIDKPFFAMGPLDDPYEFAEVDGVDFSFNLEKPLLKPGGYLSFNDCIEFFIAIINSYEAYTGFIHDSQLEQLTAFGFVQKTYKEQLPRDQWQYIPVPEIVEKMPAPLVERISNLLPPERFNRLEIPEAIYWFNYWNPYQVEKVGEEKIKSAPCEYIQKQQNGGYILVTQKENFDAGNIAHLEKLAGIYDHFNLYTIQKENPYR